MRHFIKEFKINDYILLKLENERTNIYINGKIFTQCSYVLLDIPVDRISNNEFTSYENIQSMDEAIEKLDRSLEERDSRSVIPQEMEFWAHCSNLQAWAEYGYDTRLLHSNLSFPLLKKLTEAGDPLAKKVFKEEIIKRYLEGTEHTRIFLMAEKYLEYLTWDEKGSFFLDEGVEILKELETLLNNKIKIVSDITANYPSIQIENRKVVGLRLDGHDLQEFPSQVQCLTSLKKLHFSDFKIETLPEWIGELTSLKEIVASSNHLRRLPDSIGHLKNLTNLILSFNELETFPDSIGDLCSLKWLDVAYNKLLKVPNSIGNLTSLKELYLSDNLLTSVPESLKNLTSIEYISLSSNPINKFPETFFNISSLKEFGIKNTNIVVTEELKIQIEKKKLKVIF